MNLSDAVLARLRVHPLVVLRRERVRDRAYYSWLKGSIAGAESDWFAAENEELGIWAERLLVLIGIDPTPPNAIEMYYEPIFSWNEIQGRSRIGTRAPRSCSLCGRDRSAGAVFSSEAHVLPELFGSALLTTWDECTDCNHEAGRLYENDLGAMLTPDRAVVGMRGKRGPVEVAFENDGTSVRNINNRLVLGTRDGGRNVQTALVDGKLHVDIYRAQYRPRNIVRALAKIAWQSLPPSERGAFDPLRRYVRRETEWESSEFYRVSIPGLRRVALGVWRKAAAAPAALPPIVVLVSTANGLLVWNSPDLDSGTYGPSVLPPLLRLPDGNQPDLERVTGLGDSRVKGAMQPFAYGCGPTYLAEVHQPERVSIEGTDEHGTFGIETWLSTPRRATDDIESIYQVLEGGDLIGCLDLDHSPDIGQAVIRYRFAVAPRAGMPLEPTLRFLAAIAAGTRFAVVTVDDRRAIMPPIGGPRETLDLAILEDGVRIAERLAVVREKTGADVTFPSTVDDTERHALGILAEGLRLGRVRQRTPRATSEVVIPKRIALDLSLTQSSAAFELQAPMLEAWSVGAIPVEPGPVRLVFENAHLDEDHGILQARAAGWDEEESGAIRIRYDSLRFEFLDHLPHSDNDTSSDEGR